MLPAPAGDPMVGVKPVAAGTQVDWSAPRGAHEARNEPNTDVGPSTSHGIHQGTTTSTVTTTTTTTTHNIHYI